MAMQEKPFLTIVAGREGPTEGPHSNAARIADVKAKTSAAPKKRKGRRRGPNKGKSDFAQERIEAYSELEPHICDVTKMGRIALDLFDHPDRELYDFIVGELVEKLEALRKLYRQGVCAVKRRRRTTRKRNRQRLAAHARRLRR